MTENSIRRIAIRIIGSIAPEAPVDNLESGRRFRDQFSFDSIDFLNFALALQEELNIQIPETDYTKLATLDSCVDYLLSRVGSGALGDQPQ